MGLFLAAFLTLHSGFADALYEQGDYVTAALEYSRLFYENPDTLGMPAEAIRLAKCLHELNRLEESLSLYTMLAGRLPHPDDRARASMGAGAVFADLGFYGRSSELYREASGLAGDPDLRFRAELLGALLPLHERNWRRSSSALRNLAGRSSGEEAALAAELADLASRGENLTNRSPFWCGLASAAVPGTGQLICGHTKDGLIAMGMTLASGALLYVAISEDNLSTSILMGWLTLSFYGANVQGGARAARYYNAARRRELYSEVMSRLEDWSNGR